MSYWKDRMARQIDAVSQKNIISINKQIRKYYRKAQARCIDDFEATYDKLLTTIAEGNQATPADLYNLDKYWQMQAQLRDEMQKLGDKQTTLLSKRFEAEWFDIYNAIALKSDAAYSTISKSLVNQLINQVWCADGKTWSDRIWGNTSILTETLNEGLLNCVITGKKTTELKKELRERFNASYSNADRLVRTEIAHIQTSAAQERYKSYGIQQIQFWAAPDERTCEVCGAKHKKIYPVGTEGLVPLHPNCRCCILPVVD